MTDTRANQTTPQDTMQSIMEALNNGARMVLETENAIGGVDASYIPAGSALAALNTRAKGYTVKPLVWVGDYAETAWGSYCIFDRRDDCFDDVEGFSWSFTSNEDFDCSNDYWDTKDEAKAAAQADYERRITASLTPTPEMNRAVPDYEIAIGEAGDRYIGSVAFNNKHNLPAMFRWSDLWRVMNDAASLTPTPDTPREAELRAVLDILESEVPEYHDEGMGCGLEDRNITDRYEAMSYGWEVAMDRIYSEVLNGATEELKALIDAGES